MKTRRLTTFTGVVGAIAVLFTTAGPAMGATLVVTNTADSGAGSLRQAILSANSTANVSDVINFNITGAGPHTISPLTPLPALTSPVVIDGYSQSGTSSNTLANGDNAVLKIVVLEGLVIDTTNSTVRGLAIHQIQVGATPGPRGSNVVEGCFIGLDATGTNSLASPGTGVFVQTPNNRIGGTNPGARNLISGKGAAGIEVFESFASNNVVQGNYIGTDRTGTKAIGNTDRAFVVNMNALKTTIGGTAAGAGNLISGNLDRGITLDGSSNVVQGNFIGTDVTGLQPLGNVRTGIEVGGPGNLIGGTNSGAGNVIAFNGLDGQGTFTTNGVDIKIGANGCAVLGNSIFDNLGLGIDVNANGLVTAGYPVLTLASNAGPVTVIRGTHTPSTTFRLEVFVNAACDPSGFGEGKTLLTSTNVTTDAGGNFAINWPATITPGLFLTATANGSTEFSQCRLVTAASGANNWTNSVSGKWENGANWSLNVPPYSGHSLVTITNASTKTVNNDATTATGFPSTLSVSNLLISAPGGATNTLLLAHGGTNTPLRILRSLNVGSGGAMVISNAAVNLQGSPSSVSHLNGALTLIEGELNATNSSQFYIGSTNSGSLTVSGGTFRVYYPIVGINDGANGTWHVAGGDNFVTQVFDLGDSLTATGTVRVTGGTLTTPVIYVGLFGTGNLFVSDGIFQCTSTADIASQPGSVGTFIASGGFSAFGDIILGEGVGATGTMVVTNTGAVWVLNSLDNRHGTIRMDGGGMFVAELLVKPTAQFIFNQGMLVTASAVISNNTAFVVGDGTNSAEHRLFPGGTNRFAHGLRITNNASLTGEGFVVGLVTNFGVIAPSSDTVLSGEIRINGGLVLSNSSDLRFDIAGYDISDFLRTTGSVVLNGKLSVSLTDGFESVMTNGSSFTLMTNSTPFTGAFANVASGGLLTTTDGYARFTVLYAGSRTLQLTNLVIVDTDGDGMPNWWEDQYGLDKSVADGALDLDGDAVSNLNEFFAGTKPDDSDSAFRIMAFQPESGNMRLTWTTVMGKSYRVQTNAPVNGSLSTNFVDVSPLISAPADDYESTTNFLHIGGFNTNLPARYYRVRLAP